MYGLSYYATDSDASEIVLSLPGIDEDILDEDEILSYGSLSLSDADIAQHIEFVEAMLLCTNVLLGLSVGALFGLAIKFFK